MCPVTIKECDVFVQTGKHTPQQVSYHSIVLILTPTVVRVEVDVLLYRAHVPQRNDGPC